MQNGITEKKLSHLELQDYVEKIDSLMKELHDALSFGNFNFEAIMNDPNLSNNGSVLERLSSTPEMGLINISTEI